MDKDESPETMSAGSPIVSFSIGYDADFAYTEHTIEEVRVKVVLSIISSIWPSI